MSADDFLVIDTILPALRVQSQKQALQAIASQAAEDTGMMPQRLYSRMLAAERQSTSGIGDGVAISSLQIRGLKEPYILFARLPDMIDYDSLDGEPVDLMCLILSPEKDGPYHLRLLARVSRMLRDQNLCQCLRGADSIDALQALLFDSSSRKLAA